jgi:hypothetical protein
MEPGQSRANAMPSAAAYLADQADATWRGFELLMDDSKR